MSEKQMVEYDSAPRVAYDLMVEIAGHESDTKQRERGYREYWLSLYEECYRASHGRDRK